MFTKHTIALSVWLALSLCGAFALTPELSWADGDVNAILDASPNAPSSAPSAVAPTPVVPASATTPPPDQLAKPVDPLAIPSASTAIPVADHSAGHEKEEGPGGKISSRIADFQMSAALEKAKAEYLSAKKDRLHLEAEIEVGSASASLPPMPEPAPSLPSMSPEDAAPANKEGFVVAGIFGSGSAARAKISKTVNDNPVGGASIVREGDSLNGWVVRHISEMGVRIEKGGKTKMLRYIN